MGSEMCIRDSTNAEAQQARQLFADLEGIDICPASGVAAAALLQAVQSGKVHKAETILLNITSGGFERLHKEHQLQYLQPSLGIESEAISPELVALQQNNFRPDYVS